RRLRIVRTQTGDSGVRHGFRPAWLARLEQRVAAFARVVVWGHPLHSHTHSYVHQGFARAFRALGVPTIWTDDVHALGAIDLADTLFLTEGQVAAGMPLRADCHYVLHNVARATYAPVADRVLLLQVAGTEPDDRARDGSVERVDAYTYSEQGRNGPAVLFQPWATDLLPAEFDFGVPLPPRLSQRRLTTLARRLAGRAPQAVWVGTIGDGKFGNAGELAPFRTACREAGVPFVHRAGVDRAVHMDLVRRSFVAPAIVGRWQLENGYIPCRIFKNISYGRPGLTNSPWVEAAFDSEVLCRADTAELFWASTRVVPSRRALRTQMLEVRERHTYLSRIATILEHLP
ncbi:MAG: hypothetical protein QOG68_1111, partial [Solirubrobacteraceae bacterium]|nr:hypothetical protein [Solirubrobacteraceae bacterium]